MSLWEEARERLRGHRRTAAVLCAALYGAEALCLCGCFCARRMLVAAGVLHSGSMECGLCLWDTVLAGVWLALLTVLSPMRVQTARQLGTVSGVLRGNGAAFAGEPDGLRLWVRAARVRLVYGCCLLLAGVLWVLPAACGGLLWMLPQKGEGILQLLAAAHLLIVSAVLTVLPLRVAAAGTVLPYCFLRMPEAGALRVMRAALRVTAGQTADILRMRLVHFPALLLPLPATAVLLTAEQIRAARLSYRL